MPRRPSAASTSSLRSDVDRPGAHQDLGHAGQRLIERMKHVIEPTFSVDYVTEIANQRACRW